MIHIVRMIQIMISLALASEELRYRITAFTMGFIVGTNLLQTDLQFRSGRYQQVGL